MVDSGKITKDKIQDKEEFTRNRSPRAIRNKTNKYNGNITKRGTIEVKKKDDSPPVGPIILGLFLFVVVGSALLQILRGSVL